MTDTELQMKVKCPRCGRIWTAYHDGGGIVECNCHLVCPSGMLPSDCSVTWQTFTGQLGYPTGLDTNPPNEKKHVLRNEWYCSTHDKYYYKEAIVIDVDHHRWHLKRQPREMRQSLGQY